MISIIIPTRNEEKIIRNTLQTLSLLGSDYEIIISDGASTDKTIEIARQYTDKIVIHQKNTRQTIGMGRNDGAHIATGNYLVFLDADVSIQDPTHFFEKARTVFEKNPSIVALTVYIRVSPESERISDKIIWWCLNSSYIFLNNIIHIGGASGEFQMMKTSAFRNVGGFNEVLIGGEDHELFRRLARIGTTYFEKNLTIYHTGRRGHALGWQKFIGLLLLSMLPIFIKKNFLKEWKEIR